MKADFTLFRGLFGKIPKGSVLESKEELVVLQGQLPQSMRAVHVIYYIDFGKAFNTISHSILVAKSMRYRLAR